MVASGVRVYRVWKSEKGQKRKNRAQKLAKIDQISRNLQKVPPKTSKKTPAREN
jgi:hypothetical protein